MLLPGEPPPTVRRDRHRQVGCRGWGNSAAGCPLCRIGGVVITVASKQHGRWHLNARATGCVLITSRISATEWSPQGTATGRDQGGHQDPGRTNVPESHPCHYRTRRSTCDAQRKMVPSSCVRLAKVDPFLLPKHQFPIPTSSVPSATSGSITIESNRSIWGRALQVSRLLAMTELRWAVARSTGLTTACKQAASIRTDRSCDG